MPAWAGLYDGVYQAPYGGPTIVTNPYKRLRRAFKGLTSLRDRQLLRVLITNDVGTLAAKTHRRILAVQQTSVGSLGGVRAIETVNDVNRNVVEADRTALLKELDNVHTPTFPTEKSGNSGGGKLGF